MSGITRVPAQRSAKSNGRLALDVANKFVDAVKKGRKVSVKDMAAAVAQDKKQMAAIEKKATQFLLATGNITFPEVELIDMATPKTEDKKNCGV